MIGHVSPLEVWLAASALHTSSPPWGPRADDGRDGHWIGRIGGRRQRIGRGAPEAVKALCGWRQSAMGRRLDLVAAIAGHLVAVGEIVTAWPRHRDDMRPGDDGGVGLGRL